MSQSIKLSCDLCGKEISAADILSQQTNIIGWQKKPQSKHQLTFKFEGLTRTGDLCYFCAKSLRDYIENKKVAVRGNN